MSQDSPETAPARCAALGGAAVILRLQLGAIFAFAAYKKLQAKPGPLAPSGPEDFANAIKAFKLGLPDMLVRLTVATMPWTELLAAVLLIVGFWTRAAGLLLALLLALFTVLVISALARDLNIDCGCFGDRGLICAKAMGPCKVVENLFMLAAAVLIAATPRHPLSLDALRARS